MTAQRAAGLALWLVLGVAMAQWPGQWAAWRAEAWPVLRLWPDQTAQARLQWGPELEDLLRGAAEQLPPDVAVLLVTPGIDWRATDYVVYHRALYELAPRPVVWAAPFAAEGAWEARWHLPTALDAGALAARAAALGIECIVAWGVPTADLPGEVVWQTTAGAVFTLAAPRDCAATLRPAAPEPPSIGRAMVRVGLAVLAILALGAAALPWLTRLGLALTGLEAAALSWLLGAALVSTALLWLSAMGVPLNAAVGGLSVLALPAGVWGLLSWQRRARPAAAVVSAAPPNRRQRVVQRLLLIFIVTQVLAALLLAVGRPLVVWDSWANWGLKARLIYLEQGVTPALYAEPTRLITHPDYPLLLPLLQAWLYAWVGAADDRWAGLPVVLFYGATLVAVHGGLRRLGVPASWALTAVAVIACLPDLATLTGAAYADPIVAGLAAVAVVCLLHYAKEGAAGSLALVGLTAGLLPWAKREGLLLGLTLIGAAMLLTMRPHSGHWARGAVQVAAACLLPMLVLAGPWYVFAAAARVPNPDYGPMTMATYLQQLPRLIYVGWRALRLLAEPRLGLIGVLVIFSVLLGRLDHSRRKGFGAAGWLCLGVPVAYLFAVGQSYVFSSYAPLEQHVITSLERLVLHVAPLPVLWLALRAAAPAVSEAA
jgi:hypothetical protein